jgi:hypothetical protein
MESSSLALREKTMDLKADQKQDMPAVHIHKPEPFVLEKNSALQIKLVLLSIALVAVVWVGVLIFFGVEVIRRIYG